MNYSIHYPLFRINLICLLWVIFGRTPLDAQNKDTLLNFSIRNAALDKFAKQLEDSTGFSFIYGEKIQLKKACNPGYDSISYHGYSTQGFRKRSNRFLRSLENISY